MSEEQQAVVDEANAPAQPGAEATSARDDVDDIQTLLNQYEEVEKKKNKSSEPKPEPKANDYEARIRELAERQNQIEQATWRAQVQRDVEELVGKIRGDSGVSDKIILGWLDRTVKDDPRIETAYFKAGPKERARWAETFARDFHKDFSESIVDKNATEDRSAVTAAVRGASTQAPAAKPLSLGGLSDAEARETIRKEYGYVPKF